MSMTSRERILASINHKVPDRVPVDLGASTVTGISPIAYNMLKTSLGIEKPTRIFDVVQQLANVDEEIIEMFGVDALDVNRLFCGPERDWYEVTLADGSKGEFPGWYKFQTDETGAYYTTNDQGLVLSRMPAGGTVFDQTYFPWENGFPDDFSNLKEALNSVNWVVHSHTNYTNIDEKELRSRIAHLRSSTDKAIVMSGGVKFLDLGFFLRRMDNMLTDLLMEEEKLSQLFDVLLEMHLAGLEKKCRSVGDLVDVIRFGDDLGMTTGPFMDLDIFRRLFKPRYRVLCDYVKQHSNMKIFFHACGSIRQFIPDLIDVGIDIINPVQTNCRDMDPLGLKQEFGREITFWGGGVDTSHILSQASPEEVRKDVLNRCEILSKGGGFVFATIHNILARVPPENILATYRAVQEFNS